MQDLNDKITGGSLTAPEWNEIPSELQNIIEDLGLVLSSGDLNQLGKAIVDYASAGTFYSETGVADAYVATIIGAKQGLHALSAVTDGAIVRFRPGNVNTGASTLNVNSLGVKDVVRENGDVLSVGDLDTTRDTAVRWDQTADDWRVLNSSLLTPVLLGLERPQEVLSGQLFRTSNSVVRLRPSSGDAVVVGIDNKILKTTGDLVWDMAADLEGSEVASVPLYLYARDNAGVLDEQISATVPDLPGGTKPGYKNADATRRCIGSVYNDVGQDLVPTIWGPGGQVMFLEHDADHHHDLVEAASTSWRNEVVNIPVTASGVFISASGIWPTGTGGIFFAADGATGTIPAGGVDPTNANLINALLHAVSTGSNDGNGVSVQGEIPIVTPATPAISYVSSVGLTSNFFMVVRGYRDLYAPK